MSVAPLAPATAERAARPLGRAGIAAGRRVFVLLAVGLIWIVPAFVDRRFVMAMWTWDAAVVALWLADVWRLPSPARLSVSRSWPEPAALSVPSRVSLTIANHSAQPVRVRAVDTVPASLRREPPVTTVSVPALGETQSDYAILPLARGNTRVGATYLRYQTPLGLAERWAVADVDQTIVTYPNLAEAKRYAIFLIRSRQIDLERRSSRLRGSGRAFESLREYRPGDETRDLCWTASARRGKLVTRLFEIERSQTIWVLIDSGRLMRARVGALSKLDHAATAALALAQVAVNSGDRVGMLAYGRQLRPPLPPGRGSAHLKQIIDYLALAGEDEWEADHVQAASRVLTDQKRRSLVVWITDLAETAMTPEVVRAASALLSRHVVMFVVIGEPEVRDVADRTPDSPEQMYETVAAQEIVQRRDRLLARLREGGAIAIETTADGLSLAIVNGYLDVKQRNRL